MTHGQNVLRKELIRAEQHIAAYLELMGKLRELGWFHMLEQKQNLLHHSLGRRKFLLAKLLDVQIREFDRGA